MNQLAEYVKGFFSSNLMPLVVTVIFVVLFLIGIAFMAGKKGRDWAKEQLIWVLIGAAIAYTAANIAQDIAASFGF